MTKATAPVSNLLQIYTETTEIMQHGVMWIDEEGQILHVNTQLIRELGYNREDFATKTIFQVNPYLNFIRWREIWKGLLQEGKTTLDTEHLAADGTIRPMKMRGIMIDAGGQKVCVGIVENELVLTPYIDLLQMLSEMLNAGGWQWTIVNDTYFFTREMYRLLELPKDLVVTSENIKPLLQKWLSERDYYILKEKLKQSLESGNTFEMEIAIKLPVSNVTKQFWFKGIPYHKEGKNIKLYGTIQDISTLTSRTEELYLTQYSVDHAYNMIYWIDESNKFVYVNNRTCELLGYTREELLNTTLFTIRPNATPESAVAYWKQLKEVKKMEVESELMRQDGSIFPISLTVTLLTYRGKEFACMFAKDLTAKKQRDQLIKMTSHTVNRAQELIYWLDADGNFVFANEAFCEKLGYTLPEVLEMNVESIYPDADMEEGWKTLREKGVIEAEDFIMAKNKQRIPVELSESLIVHEGIEYCCGVLRDITERRKKEEELRAAFAEIGSLKDQLEADNRVLKDEIALEFNFNNIISSSSSYKKVLKQIEQVADTEATVLILGETGTGKELLARALHQLSRRADRPMVKINCGALPDNLIESELFGHEKGAFTGAYQQKKGRFELADKGSIFLDEIGELPLDLQTKLLRVLQEGEFERVGGTQTIKVNVRVITATNRNLEQLVQEGKFRQDLFYRLNVFPIYNIPLRERCEDIPLLVRHFAEKFSHKIGKEITEIPQNILDKLCQYEFPGNVRELENIIERAVILSPGNILKIDTSFMQAASSQSTTDNTGFRTLEEMQRDHILDALRRTNGQVSGDHGAAKLLDLNDKTLHSKMKKLNIDRMDYLS